MMRNRDPAQYLQERPQKLKGGAVSWALILLHLFRNDPDGHHLILSGGLTELDAEEIVEEPNDERHKTECNDKIFSENRYLLKFYSVNG